MDLGETKQQMQKAVDWFAQELMSLQVGRATKGLVAYIQVDAGYGTMPIGQLANITLPDSQTLRIEPWDKAVVKAMEKAIYDAGTGLSPQNNGDYLFVKIPPLTKERRQDLVKQVHTMGEETKARVRQARHDAMRHIKKEFEEKLLSEDEKKHGEVSLDDVTKEFTGTIDGMIKNKEEEIFAS